ncbi:hypothetical protein M413DRAFT_446953 [Hebeloma cylindrosporum]|uniref:Uncharacterized protein n=1 Tax=Hebeloma cylindrosporum TaxID=76867 RepID=A0A0C3BRX1_HEBCY|nr:hypothetical protein M413DRAFT_446953 [Hebeloma cylindrosporum h7]
MAALTTYTLQDGRSSSYVAWEWLRKSSGSPPHAKIPQGLVEQHAQNRLKLKISWVKVETDPSTCAK